MKTESTLRKKLTAIVISMACMQYAVGAETPTTAEDHVSTPAPTPSEQDSGYFWLRYYLPKLLGGVSSAQHPDLVANPSAQDAASTSSSASSFSNGCEETGTCSAGGGGSGGPDDPPTYVLAFDPRIDDTLNKIVAHDAQLAYNTQSLNRVNYRVEGLRHQIEAVDRRVNKLQDEVQKNDKKALRGIASTAALSNAVQPSAPGKTVIGVGAATYEGVHAFAITVSHRPEKFSQMSFQGGIGTSGSGKPVMRVGISYQF